MQLNKGYFVVKMKMTKMKMVCLFSCCCPMGVCDECFSLYDHPYLDKYNSSTVVLI